MVLLLLFTYSFFSNPPPPSPQPLHPRLLSPLFLLLGLLTGDLVPKDSSPSPSTVFFPCSPWATGSQVSGTGFLASPQAPMPFKPGIGRDLAVPTRVGFLC